MRNVVAPHTKKKIAVEVTPADIAAGDPLGAFTNPVALALRRATKRPWYVDCKICAPYVPAGRDKRTGQELFTRDSHERLTNIPLAVSHWLADLNPQTKRLMKPIAFVLSQPVPAAVAG